MCDMVVCDVKKTTGETFQDQCFPWETGATVGADFEIWNFSRTYITQWRRGKKEKRKE